jgi:3-hydroxy-3-methylglutaryl CoA synthase
VVCAGCGPIEYVSRVTLQATHAVNGAREAHAAELAPYEYTIAVESLHKARDLAGHSRWQEALRIGGDAIKYGKDAEVMAREKAAKPDERHE